MAERILYPVAEAGAMLGIGRTKLSALLAAGELTPVHIGRRALVHRDELERYAAKLAGEATPGEAA